ncbi:MAG: UDP-N-acetylmuramyl-tripeptide synthetase [Chloroflexota bacterium]
MSGREMPGGRPARTVDALLQAAEPTEPRAVSGLVDRLRALGEAVAVVQPERGAPSPGGSGEARRVPPLGAAHDTVVRGVTADSRGVVPGSLFVAISGARVDGHRFAADAERAGAAALLVEHLLPGRSIPQIVVQRTRPMLAEASAWWYGDPSRELGVVGVTGTDGKTSTSLLAAAGLAAAGISTGLLGTVATQIGGLREANPEHSTTPESPALQRALRAMVRAGDRAAVIETTSHGLAMDRVRAVAYDIAIFTNLSHEHLELHGTPEAYRAAKRRLFESLAQAGIDHRRDRPDWPRTGIVNLDDPSAATFVDATIAAGARLVTFGASAAADIRLETVAEDGGGLQVGYARAGSPRRFRLRMGGRFNAWNALAAAALGWALDLDADAFEAGMEALDPVPGRMQRIERGQPFDVIVDYAHSPASLAMLLDELGPVAEARGGGLIAVFGSAGERDREKRPMMGRIAAQRCRLVVVTDEDPRAEDRNAIMAAIAAGAVAAAARPEAVLLAGKGHEATIQYADHEQPWSEQAEAEAALAELGWGS